MPLTRGEYREKLVVLSGRVDNPSFEQIAEFCPHLSLTEIEQSYASAGPHSLSLALPPLLVKGGYYVLYLSKPNIFSHSFVVLSGFNRTPQSFMQNPDLRHAVATPFADRAMDYAEQFWPDELVRDSWKEYLEFFLYDPRTNEVVFSFALGVNRGWNDLYNDQTGPLYAQLDSALNIHVLGGLEAKEIKGDHRGGHSFSLCARCGTALAYPRSCPMCNDGPSSERQYATTYFGPRLLEIIRGAGHEFEVSPERFHVSG